MTQLSISKFDKPSDSISLKELKSEPFEIVAIEQSNYDEQRGYKITTKISYSINGENRKKFHTTRRAIVAFLDQPEVQAELAKNNSIGPVKCVLTKAKTLGTKDYWMLVDV